MAIVAGGTASCIISRRFGRAFTPEPDHTRDVSARSVQARDEAQSDRIVAGRKRSVWSWSPPLPRAPPGAHQPESRYLTTTKSAANDGSRSGCSPPSESMITLRPRHCRSRPTALAESAQRSVNSSGTLLRYPITGILPLRSRRYRPRSRTAKTRDELPALHSITSSALAFSVSGKVRPSALAVPRLIASSTFVTCCTGRSAALSPLRMRPT